MNRERRKAIAAVIERVRALDLESLASAVREIADEEQEAFDGLAEGFQAGERGEVMQAAISTLERVCDALESCDLDDVVSSLEEASQ
jgi:hypothetical protein